MISGLRRPNGVSIRNVRQYGCPPALAARRPNTSLRRSETIARRLLSTSSLRSPLAACPLSSHSKLQSQNAPTFPRHGSASSSHSGSGRSFYSLADLAREFSTYRLKDPPMRRPAPHVKPEDKTWWHIESSYDVQIDRGYPVFKFNRNGSFSKVSITDAELREKFHLPKRDIRMLVDQTRDPIASSPVLVSRAHTILLSMFETKALITKDSVMIFDANVDSMKHFARGFKSFLETTRHHKNGNNGTGGHGRAKPSDPAGASRPLSSSSSSSSPVHSASNTSASAPESLREPTGAFQFSRSAAHDDPLHKAAVNSSKMRDKLADGVHTSHDGQVRSPASAKSDQNDTSQSHDFPATSAHSSESARPLESNAPHTSSDAPGTSSSSGRPPDPAKDSTPLTTLQMAMDPDDEPLPTLPSPVAPPQQFSDMFAHTGNVAGGTPHGLVFPEDFELRALEGILRYVCHVQNSWVRVFDKSVQGLENLEKNTQQEPSASVYSWSSLQINDSEESDRQTEGYKQVFLLKDRLSQFQEDVRQTIKAFNHLLDHDDQMLEMRLTARSDPEFEQWPEYPFMHEEVEDLLQSFRAEFSTLAKKSLALQKQLTSFQDLMELNLDNKRNNMIAANLKLSVIMVSLSTGSAMASLFGMNLLNSLESVPFGFYIATGSIATIAFTVHRRTMKKYFKKQPLRETELRGTSEMLNHLEYIDYLVSVNGKVKKAHFPEQMHSMFGVRPSEHETEMIYKLLDLDGDQAINKSELPVEGDVGPKRVLPKPKKPKPKIRLRG